MREILYGRNAVYESLRARRREFYRLLIADTVRATDIVADILTLAERIGVPVERVPRRHLDWLGEANHQGVALEASDYPYVDLDDILAESARRAEPPFLLLLDLLQDPQNVGALLRTAEAVGVHGVVIQQRRAVGITPTVVHTSAGAVEHLLVAQVPNLPDTIERLKAQEVWVVGLEAARGARRYDQTNFTGSVALVVGSEGEGLRRLVQERCDLMVQLPMMGKVTSLNAAVAGSVVLYEAWRQRAVGKPS
ncbi:MAG: 23S rRNA (guanosine(2251)-2'-O)-methyltransferase RlmB [Anaerolineae bacterium]